MSRITATNYDPIALIDRCTTAEPLYHKLLLQLLQRLYQHEMFKPVLDIMATQALHGLLTFIASERKNYQRDLGVCRAIEGNIFNSLLNTFRKAKVHQVVIRHMSGAVLVHELTHVLENLYEHLSFSGFANTIQSDISRGNTANVALRTVVERIMIKEVQAYPADHRVSELFARYFEIMAMSHEIAGKAEESGGYSIDQVHQLFANTEQWIRLNIFDRIPVDMIDPNIAAYSQRYIKHQQDIKHLWSQERVHSKHTQPHKPKWSRAVKSIKDV